MVRDILMLDLALNSVSKPLNQVEKIPYLVAMNSYVIFCVNCYVFK